MPGRIPLTVRDQAASMARANPKWSRPKGAAQQCEQASFRFCMLLEERGIASTLVTCEEPAHVAVLVDGLVVDLTARQFDPDAAFPMVTTEREWRSWLAGLTAP